MASDNLIIHIATRGAGVAAGQIESVSKASRGLKVAMAAFAVATAVGVKSAMDFEEVMAEAGAVTGATKKQMDALSASALTLGAQYGVGATQAGQAITELAKGGLDAATIMSGGLAGALNLAAAGGMDVASAAAGAANALNLFGLEGKDTSHVADAFATAANATTADVSDFTIALSQGGSAAKAAGLDFDQATVALEALARNGVKGSDAGTSLKSMLVQLASPTAESQGLMKKLNLDFFDAQGNFKDLSKVSGMLRKSFGGMTQEQRLQAASTIAGTDGMRGLLALYDTGPKGVKAFADGLAKEGTAKDVALKKNNTLAGSLRRLRATFEAVAIKSLLPFLKGAADGVNDFLKAMQSGRGAAGLFKDSVKALGAAVLVAAGYIGDIWNATKTLIGWINTALPVIVGLATTIAILNAPAIAAAVSSGALTLAIIGLSVAQGAAAVTGGALAAVMAVIASPVLLVTGVIAGLVAGLVVLWKRNEGFRVWVKGAWSDITRWIGGAAESISGFFSGIPQALTSIFNGIVNMFIRNINRIIGVMNKAIEAYNAIPMAPNIGTISEIGMVGGGGPMSPVGTDASFRGGAKLASGGHVRDGGWALVGERGPELAHLPGGSTVYDAKQTASAMSGGSQHVTWEIRGGNPAMRQLAQLITESFTIEAAHGNG